VSAIRRQVNGKRSQSGVLDQMAWSVPEGVAEIEITIA